VARFLADFRFGRSPQAPRRPDIGAGQTEETLFERFVRDGVPDHLKDFGTTPFGQPDMLWEAPVKPQFSFVGYQEPEWQELFGEGLKLAVSMAVDVVGGEAESMTVYRRQDTGRSAAQRAKAWFVNSYPLLGSLAVVFDIIESAKTCQTMDISVAAVSVETQEIYLNPAAGLGEEELRFVMAHELLHVGLRHHARRAGRDPFFWNVACDYVINGWLIEMGVGLMPSIGALYDPDLAGQSAETIYDHIIHSVKHFRREWTFRGKGQGDILDPSVPDWWATRSGLTLDAFYRRCLAQGLEYHDRWGRGLLPAGLLEEIRALTQPPIPWDVELAQWFDAHFQPVEKRRTYARPSRRQAATPDIPRPSYVAPLELERGRTFGVVLDTSGSMPRALLGKALGAIASYSVAHDVPAVRVVFCDAAAYDQGYLPPEAIADRVRIKGRGGTVLQPGINLLEKAEDFPAEGPILVITDGYCDRLRIRHEHAFLIPEGHHLPFRPAGPVFQFS
jgi:predicted metal-dependent peptidase